MPGRGKLLFEGSFSLWSTADPSETRCPLPSLCNQWQCRVPTSTLSLSLRRCSRMQGEMGLGLSLSSHTS